MTQLTQAYEQGAHLVPFETATCSRCGDSKFGYWETVDGWKHCAACQSAIDKDHRWRIEQRLITFPIYVSAVCLYVYGMGEFPS